MKWVPCTERMPDKGQRVLVYVPRWSYGPYDIAAWNGMTWRGWFDPPDRDTYHSQAAVTHWSALTAPETQP